jgi:hypothetical protein
MRSDKSSTACFKGVHQDRGRYQAKCTTAPCHKNHLGSFDAPEDAAQAYLQHYENKHPKELEKERAPPPPPPVLPEVQHHLHIRSDKAKSGYKGVTASKGRYQAKCNTPPCRGNYLGLFDTLSDAAQTYLQHHQHSHSHQLPTDTWFQCDDCNKWRRFAAAHAVPDVGEEEQWCCKDSGGLYTCEQDEEKEEEEVVVEQRGGKKRQREQTSDLEHLSDQLQGENEALKRCKQEFVEEDHAALHQQISALEAEAQHSAASALVS